MVNSDQLAGLVVGYLESVRDPDVKDDVAMVDEMTFKWAVHMLRICGIEVEGQQEFWKRFNTAAGRPAPPDTPLH